MDKSIYYAALKKMQEAGTNAHYCHGWASGVLANTPLEEQRITAAYSAGYEDGKEGNSEGYRNWIENKS